MGLLNLSKLVKGRGTVGPSAIDVGNYFALLFHQTKEQFALDNAKLGYLCCIAQFSCMASGDKLFDDNISYDHAGFYISGVRNAFPSKITSSDNTRKEPIDEDVSDESAWSSQPSIYKVSEYLSPADKRIIYRTFERFGAYSSAVLAYMLNAFLPLIESRQKFGIISDSDITEFFIRDEEKYIQNEVFDFIISSGDGAQIAQAEVSPPESEQPQEQDEKSEELSAPEIIAESEIPAAADENKFRAGERFSFTVSPDDGYDLDEIEVITAVGDRVDCTVDGEENGVYTCSFIVPSCSVDISCSYKPITLVLTINTDEHGSVRMI